MPKVSTVAPAPLRLLRLPEVCARTGLTRSPLYRRVAAGEFPSPVSLGARAVAWRDDEVQAWIEALEPAATGSPVLRKPAAAPRDDDEAPTLAGRNARSRRV